MLVAVLTGHASAPGLRLRGFPDSFNLLELSGQRWEDLELSDASLPSLRFFDSEIVNCRVDSTRCQDWRLWNTTMAQSSFVDADLRESALATWWEQKANTWRGVRFDRADMRGLPLEGALFEGCSFRGTRLEGTEFKQTELRDCVFAGRLKDLRFDGRSFPDAPTPNPLVNVDFSAASFEFVEFDGCRFEGVSLPRGVFAIERFPAVAGQVNAALAANDSLEAKSVGAMIENAIRTPGPPDSVGVFNRADYVAFGGEALADFAEALFHDASGQSG
ncbi:pentapeptide repeat-containing protein [Nocardioides cheoyonin]|uniref:pentapeptide repeat-containing protein n=1 Tax=Nocardioides cheoyonin TaxID=3156615 RepID=UPI0032B5A0C3